MTMFSKPASASGIKWEDLKGSLLIVEPSSVEVGIPTQFGESDAVKATVSVLDGDDAGTVYVDTLIFPKILQTSVKGSIGGMVLGRLGHGVAKPKQSPPWVLEDFTADDAKVAEKFIADRGEQAPAATGSDIPF